jgi:hypothetical protein
MSKKLIAVASAAALALTALVGVAPANAILDLSENIVVGGSPDGAGTSASPYLLDVPATGLVEDGDVTEVTLSTDLNRKSVTLSSKGGVKLLDNPADDDYEYTIASGKSSLTLTTDASGGATFYVFTTSTTKNRLDIRVAPGTDDEEAATVWFKGVAGEAYDIADVKLPSSVLPEQDDAVVTFLVKDAFGNAVETGTVELGVLGGGGSAANNQGATEYSSTLKRWIGTFTAGTDAGSIAASLTLTVSATDDQKAAFGSPVSSFFGTISAQSLTERIEALEAKLANTVSKAKYNNLVRKYNKITRGKKASLVK